MKYLELSISRSMDGPLHTVLQKMKITMSSSSKQPIKERWTRKVKREIIETAYSLMPSA